MGPALALVLSLVVLFFGMALAWPYLRSSFQQPDSSVAQRDPARPDVKPSPVVDTPKPLVVDTPMPPAIPIAPKDKDPKPVDTAKPPRRRNRRGGLAVPAAGAGHQRPELPLRQPGPRRNADPRRPQHPQLPRRPQPRPAYPDERDGPAQRRRAQGRPSADEGRHREDADRLPRFLAGAGPHHGLLHRPRRRHRRRDVPRAHRGRAGQRRDADPAEVGLRPDGQVQGPPKSAGDGRQPAQPEPTAWSGPTAARWTPRRTPPSRRRRRACRSGPPASPASSPTSWTTPRWALFLDKLDTAIAPARGEKGLEGKIQRPDDPLPLDAAARPGECLHEGGIDSV